MFKKNRLLILLIAAFVLLTSGSFLYSAFRSQIDSAVDGLGGNAVATARPAKGALTEDRGVYASTSSPVREIYLTILDTTKEKDPNAAPQDAISFQELQKQNYRSTVEHSLDAIMQEGDAKGPAKSLFGYDVKSANGVITTRGKSTSVADQKSYKVTLYKSAGLWEGQSIINFVKHPFDLTRVRNSVCFALFRTIPNMTSLRTQFVRLHVKDLSASKTTGEFEDYGLFEQVEQPNKKFLVSHGLDVNGNLYKAEYFEFFRYADVIRPTDDPLYDKSAFEAVIKQKNGGNHKQLIKMLDAVNDYSRNINDIVDEYFDRDNYLTWLAVNILLDNSDTNSQNFLLYNPNNTDKWYFLPWDYDGGLDFYNQKGIHTDFIANWQSGIPLYWGVVLHRRFFSDPNNVNALVAKINEMERYINKDAIDRLLKTYYPLVSGIIQADPDIDFLPGTREEFESEYWRLEDVPAKMKARFLRDLEKPMPIYLGEVKQGSDKFTFQWDNSYDLQGDDLYYTFVLAEDPAMKKVLVEKRLIQATEADVPPLAKGTYYWRVTVTDAKGYQQEAFDELKDEFGNVFFGEAALTIN